MANERTGADDVERYEQLRRRATAGGASGWRLGLALLHRRGVAAWMQAWHEEVASTPTVHPPATAEVGDEVVGVLASITLSCLGAG